MNLGLSEIVIICIIALIVVLIPIGVAVAIRSGIIRAKANAENDPRPRVPCPYCSELILPDAKVCRFCGHELETDRNT